MLNYRTLPALLIGQPEVQVGLIVLMIHLDTIELWSPSGVIKGQTLL
jgi:hypothetical protein